MKAALCCLFLAAVSMVDAYTLLRNRHSANEQENDSRLSQVSDLDEAAPFELKTFDVTNAVAVWDEQLDEPKDVRRREQQKRREHQKWNEPKRRRNRRLKKSGKKSAAPTGSTQPSANPSEQPSAPPTNSAAPSQEPSSHPSRQPSAVPTVQPSQDPTTFPSRLPSLRPSLQPSSEPTLSSSPSETPSRPPSDMPSLQPSAVPTSNPSKTPSDLPSKQPSEEPTTLPTSTPSLEPSTVPSANPSSGPSKSPSATPSSIPSQQPSLQPTSVPSVKPSLQPSSFPSLQPSSVPSKHPTSGPTVSSAPSGIPSASPSMQPTMTPPPSSHPSLSPSSQPSVVPTTGPSSSPSLSFFPTVSAVPTVDPLGVTASDSEWTCRRSPPETFTAEVTAPITYSFEVTVDTGTNVDAVLSEGERLIGQGVSEIFCSIENGDSFYLTSLNSGTPDVASPTETCDTVPAEGECHVVDGGFTVTLKVEPGAERKLQENDTINAAIGARFKAALDDLLPAIASQLASVRSTSVSAITNLTPDPVVPQDNTMIIIMATIGCAVGFLIIAAVLVAGAKRRARQEEMKYYVDDDLEDEDDDTEVPSSPRKSVHVVNEEISVDGESLYAVSLALEAETSETNGIRFISAGDAYNMSAEHHSIGIEAMDDRVAGSVHYQVAGTHPSPYSEREMRATLRELGPQPHAMRPSSVPVVDDTIDL